MVHFYSSSMVHFYSIDSFCDFGMKSASFLLIIKSTGCLLSVHVMGLNLFQLNHLLHMNHNLKEHTRGRLFSTLFCRFDLAIWKYTFHWILQKLILLWYIWNSWISMYFRYIKKVHKCSLNFIPISLPPPPMKLFFWMFFIFSLFFGLWHSGLTIEMDYSNFVELS